MTMRSHIDVYHRHSASGFRGLGEEEWKLVNGACNNDRIKSSISTVQSIGKYA